MEEVRVVNTTTSPIVIILLFIISLTILGLIIWILVIMVPKNNVQLYGNCTHQLDCATGLVCSQRTGSTSVCLNGLEQLCTTDSECASPFVCSENNNIKVCMVKTNS